MSILVSGYDPSQPVGQRLSPEMRAEIAALAPSVVTNGSVTGPKLADGAVGSAKLGAGSVDTTKIATGGVAAINLKAGAVSTAALADESVTPDKAGIGVPTAQDTSGNPISLTFVPISKSDFQALASRTRASAT